MGSFPGPIRARIKLIKKDDGSFDIDTTEFMQELNDNLRDLYEPITSSWAVTNKTVDRTLDCDSNDALVLGDVLGTLIDDLIKKGIIEQ